MSGQVSSLPHFKRPNKRRVIALLNRGLGPLPDGMVNLSRGDVQTPWWGDAFKPSRWLLYTAVAAMMGIGYTLYAFVPWTHYSVVTGVLHLCGVNDVVAFGIYVLCFAVFFFLLARRISPKKGSREQTKSGLKTGFIGPALAEELWFRAGSESWTWRQRVYSCVYFGLLHILNLVVPLCAAVALILPGGIFMVVYLRAYRKFEDSRWATLASGRFHAEYNELILKIFPVLLVVVFIWKLVIPLLMLL
jgi:hypothetical protein